MISKAASDFFVLNSTNSIADPRTKSVALDLISFLRNSGMTFEKGGGYWKNQSYWYVCYRDESVCYILFNANGDEKKFYPFTVWSDDSSSAWYSRVIMDAQDIAVKHIDFCENCGACKGGTEKTIFHKKYNNVCKTTFRFIAPSEEETNCIKHLILLRKADIERQYASK